MQKEMMNRAITILIILLTNVSLSYSDTIDYWKIKKENIIKISANINSFDSTEFINIDKNDLKNKFEVSYFKDVNYKTEKKLFFKRKGIQINELKYKISDIGEPMKFTLKDIINTNFSRNDTIKIYYTETGNEYSNKSLKYIGSLIVWEDINKTDLTNKDDRTNNFIPFFLIILLPIMTSLSKSRKKKRAN